MRRLCVFFRNGRNNFREIWSTWTFSTYGGLVQNLIGKHTIFWAVLCYYSASYWCVARDGRGEIGSQNVGIIHVFLWDWHLGWWDRIISYAGRKYDGENVKTSAYNLFLRNCPRNRLSWISCTIFACLVEHIVIYSVNMFYSLQALMWLNPAE